jgi:hypothetical protein
MLDTLRTITGNGYTVHGIRTSFEDWGAEATEISDRKMEVICIFSEGLDKANFSNGRIAIGDATLCAHLGCFDKPPFRGNNPTHSQHNREIPPCPSWSKGSSPRLRRASALNRGPMKLRPKVRQKRCYELSWRYLCMDERYNDGSWSLDPWRDHIGDQRHSIRARLVDQQHRPAFTIRFITRSTPALTIRRNSTQAR